MLSVGVCTFRRPHVAETLASLGAQTRRPDLVIVADNDDGPSAEPRVRQAAAAARLPLLYLHAPASNIAVARNAVLAAAERDGVRYLGWLDDDEVAPSGWLAAMGDGLGSAAAVFGPALAEYENGAPDWMRKLRPHDQRVPVTRGLVRFGHTANALVDLAAPPMAGLRFDEAFGRTGGEDADYFHRAFRQGARFALIEAPVRERVTSDRLDPAWLTARRRRAGATYYAILPAGRRRAAFAAAAKAAACAGAAAAAGREEARWRARLRGAFHEGVVGACLGVRPREHYGETAAVRTPAAPFPTSRPGSQ